MPLSLAQYHNHFRKLLRRLLRGLKLKLRHGVAVKLRRGPLLQIPVVRVRETGLPPAAVGVNNNSNDNNHADNVHVPQRPLSSKTRMGTLVNPAADNAQPLAPRLPEHRALALCHRDSLLPLRKGSPGREQLRRHSSEIYPSQPQVIPQPEKEVDLAARAEAKARSRGLQPRTGKLASRLMAKTPCRHNI